MVRCGPVTRCAGLASQVLVGVALWGPQRGPDPPELTWQQPSDEMWCVL